MADAELLTSRAFEALPLPRDASSGRLFIVTSAFGGARAHEGIDLATRDANGRPVAGLPVFSPIPSYVARVVSESRGGLVIVLGDAQGGEVKLAHLSRAHVAPGELVQPGQHVGDSGASGKVSGPHLHLEVRDASGHAVDPLPLLQEVAAQLPEESRAISSPVSLGLFAALLALLGAIFKKGKNQ